jgi:AraC-like DNA-binding protein
MDLNCEERISDAPFIERIWRSEGTSPGPFISMAEIECGLVVSKYRGQTTITLRGPSTQATPAFCPADAEFIGIQFKVGVSLRGLPARLLMDRHDQSLPEAGSRSFWLHGSAWQYPDFENADTFVRRLVHADLLAYDPLVGEVLQGGAASMDLSVRTVQRRFLQSTGLVQGTIHQINRAQYAASLLKTGAPILETVYQAGYFDQPHMTRSLKQYIGLTPAQVLDPDRPERLSFLYKKNSPWLRYNPVILRSTESYSRAFAASF